jgi:hypothetical protein
MRLAKGRLSAAPIIGAGRRRTLAAAALCGLVASAPLMLSSASARGAQSATATVTLNVVIKSVTLSATSLTYGQCRGGYSTGSALGFPNGTCSAGPVSVTNGAAPSTILISGANAVPSDGGTQWTMCVRTTFNPCSPNAPGPNRFAESNAPGGELTPSPTCDAAFRINGAGCPVSPPGLRRTETLTLTGPSSSTDQSPRFTTQITWIAS